MSKNLFIDYFKNKKDVFISSCILILLILILNLLSGNFGLFDSIFIRYFAFCIMLIIFFIVILQKEVVKKSIKSFVKKNYNNILGYLLVLFSLIILFSFNYRFIWVSCIPIFLSGLFLIENSCKLNSKKFDFFIFFSFIYSLFIVIIDNIPILWSYFHKISIALTQVISNLYGKSLVYGPSVNGFWILILFLILIISLFFISGRNIKKFILSLFGLIITWIIFIGFLSLTSFEKTDDILNSQYIFIILGLIPIIFFYVNSKTSKFTINNFNFQKQKFKKIYKKTIFWIFLLLFISGFCLTSFISSGSEGGNILIYKKGIMGNWNQPEYDDNGDEVEYGRYASGMFGLLPKHLNNYGHHVSILDDDENITNNTFKNIDVFVVINLDKNFSTKEFNLIWNFVANGGSLLVLGDHTDVGGIMNTSNNLLRPVGISFRYDSALPLNYDNQPQWYSCMHFFNHPITNMVPNENWVAISVGASLNISKSSFPIIVAKNGFSDIGNYSNDGYLGDYEHQEIEQLNDIILVAGAYYGNGKVLVFGDTSSFQNSAHARTYNLINNVFRWLNNSKTEIIKYIQIFIFFLFLIIILIIYIFSKNGNKFSIFLPIIFILSLITSSLINPIILGGTNIEGSIMYVDTSHGERISFNVVSDYSVTGLNINIARNNYSTYYLNSFSEDKITKSKGLILIAPTKTFNNNEINFIKNFIKDGGLVILSTGYQDKEASQGLLDEFNLDIQKIPFGTFPLNAEKTEPQFQDAWPIEFEKNDINTWSFYNFTDNDVTYHLIIFKKYGSGGILLIGDSQFLLDKNLESYTGYNLGNIEFLKQIIETIQEKGVIK